MSNPKINVEGIPKNVGDFLQNFYLTSDNREASLEDYTSNFQFDENTIFKIGQMQQVKDKKSVEEWRSKAWIAVDARKHIVHGVFPKSGKIDSSSPECMLYGRVDYTLKDGKTSGADWGGHIIFHPSSLEDGAQPKMSSYNVWVTPDQAPKI